MKFDGALISLDNRQLNFFSGQTLLCAPHMPIVFSTHMHECILNEPLHTMGVTVRQVNLFTTKNIMYMQ